MSASDKSREASGELLGGEPEHRRKKTITVVKARG